MRIYSCRYSSRFSLDSLTLNRGKCKKNTIQYKYNNAVFIFLQKKHALILTEKKLIIFDLGGTLIDSLPDLSIAINKMLVDMSKKTYPQEIIMKWLGNGLKMIVKRALSGGCEIQEVEEQEFEKAYQLFMLHYKNQKYQNTHLYPYVKETLGELYNRGYKMSIVTNNPQEIILPMLQQLEINRFFQKLFGYNSFAKKKPHSQPLLEVCKEFNILPNNTVMVGDSKNDVLAANNANIDSIGLLYGYNYNRNINDYFPSVVVNSFDKIQSEATLRSIAHSYPYDDIDEKSDKLTLRSGVDEINKALEKEISERLLIAGIEIIEARISNLSYAPEIATVMLQRQQAQAIIGARKKIVEGSVGIVQMALDELEGKIEIKPEQKMSMINNLLVVLCSEHATTPVVKSDF